MKDKDDIKNYNTRRIRAVFLMFDAMIESNEINFDYFNDYTGLSRGSYCYVMKLIKEMIIDLGLDCKLERLKYERENKYTRYYIYNYKIDIHYPIDYSYVFHSSLEYRKKIDYSIVLVYLMLKNDEEVNYKKLYTMFPFFTKRRFKLLLSYLRLLCDEEIYIKNKNYKIRDFSFE